MIDKEKILAKIEFLLNETNYEPFTDEVFGRIQSLKELKSYIDSLQEEPVSVSINFEQELYKAFGHVKDFTLCLKIAKRFYDIGKNSQEPVSEQKLSNVQRIGKNWKESVSEDLEEAAHRYYEPKDRFMDGFKKGANWKEDQFEKNRLAASSQNSKMNCSSSVH